MRHSTRTAAVALTLVAAALPGCLISSENHVSYTGDYVPSDKLGQITIGESTPAFTTAILGEPTSKTDLEDGTSIWRWDYVERRSGEGAVLLVFAGENSSEVARSTYVQFENGVASKKWQS